MRHEIRDTFQHASRLQHEGREGHPGQVHPYSTENPIVEAFNFGGNGMIGRIVTDLSWAIREEIIDPSFSSLKSVQGISVLVPTKSIIEAGSSGRGRGEGREGTREMDRRKRSKRDK